MVCTSLKVCEHLRDCERQVEHKVQEEQVPDMYSMLRSLQNILD